MEKSPSVWDNDQREILLQAINSFPTKFESLRIQK
jgi:hypothetical protein